MLMYTKEPLDEGERGEWKTGLKLNTEKIKIMASGPVPSVICSVVSDSLWLHRLWPSSSSVHGILQARILEWVAIFSPGDLPNPGIEPGSPALQADFLPSEPPGKPPLHGKYKGEK